MISIQSFIIRVIDWFYRPFKSWMSIELFRYAACGGGNLVLDWILYFITYNFIIGHDLIYLSFPFTICLTPHIASLCIVFPITLLTGFWLQRNITFTQSSLHSVRQLLRYVSIVALNLAINYWGLKLCVEVWAWYPTPSKITITLLTVIVSFFGQKYFSFRK